MISTMTSKGQVTLPKKLREDLHLEKGDRVSFERGSDGWILKRRRPTGKSDGAAVRFVRREGALSVDDMKQAARKAAADHYRGSSQS